MGTPRDGNVRWGRGVEWAWQAGDVTDPESGFDCGRLRTFAGTEVRVRLIDGIEWVGRLRTELLSERSLSVYLARADGEGATLYLDQIAEIVPNDSAHAD